MMFPVHSQSLSKNQKIRTIVSENGDTLIQMSVSDAKIILKTILEKDVNDSLLSVYMKRDSLNKNLVVLKDDKISDLNIKTKNLESIVISLNKIISNNDLEMKKLKETINAKNDEIRKQRNLKILGFVGSIILPVLSVLFISGIN